MQDTFTSQLTGISRGKFVDLSIKRAGNFQDINVVLDGITNSVDLSDYYTSAQTDDAIAVETAARTAALQQETDARNLLATNTASALASKQVSLVAGANIQLSGGSNSATISATGPLEVAVDGALQTATRVDFVAPTSSLASGVLSIGPPDFQSRLSLIYASSADALDLTRSQAGALLWDGAEVASKASVDDERTARQTFQNDTNIVLNTKQTVDDAQVRVRLGTSADNKDLTKSGAQLAWGGNTLVEAPTLNALETYTIAQLALKQDTLTAGTGISISGATISATGGSGLELAVNGTVQSGATRLDLLANEATLSGTTLLLGPPLTTRVGLWFASSADHKDLTQGAGGVLKWGTEIVQMEAVRPFAQFVKAYTQTFNGGYNVIQFDQATVSSGVTLNTSNHSFTVARAGVYHLDVGLRNGSGADTWTGISLTNASGAVLAKSYATGQVTPVAAEGHTWHLLASLATETADDLQLSRNVYGMTVMSPGDPNAGWAIVATLALAS